MGNKARVLVFILINILISAAVTLLVLWLWERAHPRPEVASNRLEAITGLSSALDQPQSIDQIENEPLPVITNEDIQISIRTIVGAGDLQVEYVEIMNQGQNMADLTTWQLLDEDGHLFTFPALILSSGGAVKVFSRSGTNTVIELYWQADSPIWRPGETARLMNAAGDFVTSYSIP